jgi:hypothetical protein
LTNLKLGLYWPAERPPTYRPQEGLTPNTTQTLTSSACDGKPRQGFVVSIPIGLLPSFQQDKLMGKATRRFLPQLFYVLFIFAGYFPTPCFSKDWPAKTVQTIDGTHFILTFLDPGIEGLGNDSFTGNAFDRENHPSIGPMMSMNYLGPADSNTGHTRNTVRVNVQPIARKNLVNIQTRQGGAALSIANTPPVDPVDSSAMLWTAAAKTVGYDSINDIGIDESGMALFVFPQIKYPLGACPSNLRL